MLTRDGGSHASRWTLIGYAIVTLVAATLGAARVLEPLDHAALDAQFAALRAIAPRAASSEVVIVGIDEDTVKSLPEPVSLWHPHFSRFLQASAAGGAAAVGLDVVFPDRSYDSIVPGYDRQLAIGIVSARRAAPLVIARTVDSSGEARAIHPLFVAAAGADAVAYAMLPLDGDAVVRRFDERLGAAGEAVPTLAGELARRMGVQPGRGLIDFSRGARFDYVPLHRVLSLHEAGDSAALQKLFAGKPVLLGAVFKFEDRLGAPVKLAAWDQDSVTVPGVVLHAQALRNLLDSGFIAEVPRWLTIALCVLLASVWWFATTLRRAALTLLAGVLLIAAGSTVALARGSHVPPSAPIAALVLATVTRSAREAALGMRERLKLRRAFSGYVSPDVMDDILSGEIAAELGGVNRFVCALFSDIRGYTTRSEGMSPQEIVAFLNSYFEQVVNVIHARGGTVVTFMGDGIMAVFGAPKALDNPCAQAFAAARGLLEYVHDFNVQARAAGVAPIDIGVGLHAGDAVVGHVGSSSRHDYTAIGDVINVASRLEGVTKEVGYRLVYSGTVAQALPAGVSHTALGLQQIKGHTPVEAYGFEKIG
ncbi:MAG: adenylate/guanylate cyclase with Chase sensor [Betaproteobacteria bacterium]|nr:adenylate/guanylate cyclase with Chase sensor [Betaproteobacteria bacterium]